MTTAYCRVCEAKLRLQEAHVGKTAQCPGCKTRFRVPPLDQLDPGDRIPESAILGEGAKPAAAAAAEPDKASGAASEKPANDSWWMRTPEGAEYGPADRASLDGWVRENRVSAECQIRRGDGPWQPAAAVFPQLKQLPQTPAQPSGHPAPAPAAPSQPGSQFRGGGPNPFADQPQYGGNPYASPQYYATPSGRGGTILALGIISGICSLVTCFYCIPGLIALGCGIPAITMGSHDLEGIDAGRLPPYDRGQVQAGLILGWVGVVITGLWVLGIGAMAIFIATVEA